MEALGNLFQSLSTEGALSVEHGNSATTLGSRLLCSDNHGMRKLRLATSVLAVDLADTARFEPASKDPVKILAAGADLEAVLALLLELSTSHETRAVRLHSGQLMDGIEMHVLDSQGPSCKLP